MRFYMKYRVVEKEYDPVKRMETVVDAATGVEAIKKLLAKVKENGHTALVDSVKELPA